MNVTRHLAMNDGSGTWPWTGPGPAGSIHESLLPHRVKTAEKKYRMPGGRPCPAAPGALTVNLNLRGDMDPRADYTAWNFWLAAGQFIFTTAVGFYAWMTNRAAAKEKTIKKIEDRVCRLETESITRKDLAEVHEKVNQVGKQVSELIGSVRSISGAVAMIQEYLMNKGGRE